MGAPSSGCDVSAVPAAQGSSADSLQRFRRHAEGSVFLRGQERHQAGGLQLMVRITPLCCRSDVLLIPTLIQDVYLQSGCVKRALFITLPLNSGMNAGAKWTSSLQPPSRSSPRSGTRGPSCGARSCLRLHTREKVRSLRFVKTPQHL